MTEKKQTAKKIASAPAKSQPASGDAKEETVRLNVEVSKDLYKRLKIYTAYQDDATISTVVRKLLDEHLPVY